MQPYIAPATNGAVGTFCDCPCHVEPMDREFIPSPYHGAAVHRCNIVEAAVACDSCRNWHTPALLGTQLANYIPQLAAVVRGYIVTTPEGKRLAWEEYVRLKQQERIGDAKPPEGV